MNSFLFSHHAYSAPEELEVIIISKRSKRWHRCHHLSCYCLMILEASVKIVYDEEAIPPSPPPPPPQKTVQKEINDGICAATSLIRAVVSVYVRLEQAISHTAQT